MLELKPDGCGKMSYTYIENIKACRSNEKGFIYRLIEMDEKVPEWAAIDVFWDADVLDGQTAYIGMTMNPARRGMDHRGEKGKHLMMQIIGSANCPDEAQYKERKAIWDHKVKFGVIPKFNKSSWGGA